MNHDVQSLSPATTEEVSAAVKAAITHGYRLATNRTADLPDNFRRLNLGAMQATVDYPARDMTITVQAGMPVGTLQDILKQENQQLPIDCCDPSISVGALVASDVAGSRQYGYGTARDYLIGIEAVDGTGRVFHAGGRVVKNVAGYDLCRLLIGSRGSLAVLTQLTFKLKPIPEQTEVRAFGFRSAKSFEAALTALNTTKAAPVMLDFRCAASNSADTTTTESGLPWSLFIGVDGSAESCHWQFSQLRKDCAEAEEVVSAETSRVSIEEHAARCGSGWQLGDVIVRTVPSELAAIAGELAAEGCSSSGHAGNGILCVSCDKPEAEQQSLELRTICERVVAGRAASVTQWGSDHPAHSTALHSVRLRDTFDPHHVFALTNR
ncbi:MAG: FAD-binding oxidoreductase [Fuerstiella sp.]